MRISLMVGTAMFIGLTFFPNSSSAQLLEDFHQPGHKPDCCLRGAAQQLADALGDWGQLGRYLDDDMRLEAQPPQPGRVVFLGDSITDLWDFSRYFPGKPYINRGISGQTTPQMVLRIFQDVIDLHPAAVAILAGTNDIGENTGPETPRMVEENLQAMTELAQVHGVKVILCSVTPVNDDNKMKWMAHRPPADVVKLNNWINQYADKAHAGFADYFAALVDERGLLAVTVSDDGLHPNAKGYAAMAAVVEAAIAKALK